ncbi:MAG: sulfotransferase [Alphaproteobacteria bacterium]|nr:sulfotransferase [Alphaproteobacteria bacterium]
MPVSKAQDQTQSLFQKAGDFIRSGQLDDAESILKELAAVVGVQDEAYSKLGVVYNFRKDKEKAESFFLKALEANNSFVPALHNLCLLYTQEGIFDKAFKYGERGLVEDPSYIELYFAMALAHRLNGNLDQALDYMRRALELDEKNLRVHSNYAALLLEQGKIFNKENRKKDALQAYHKALEVYGSFVPAYYNLCMAYTDAAQFEKAIEYGRKGLELEPTYLELYYAVALAYRGQGKLSEGLEYLEQALAYDESNVRTLINYGALLFEQGTKDKAQEIFETIIKLVPENASAHRMLSLIESYKKGHPHISQMENLIVNTSLGLQAKSEMHFALGKAYESAKDYGESYKNYKEANALYRQSLNYSIEKERELFENIKRVFTVEYIDKNKLSAQQGKVPIFILGMPRSGTSLIEQILASHPDVYGAGELKDLGAIQFHDFEITLNNYVDVYSNMKTSDFQVMSRTYIRKLDSLTADHIYVTDKMPMNFRFIGLIACLFPEAKIVHCIRDPRDTCLSIFKTFFTGSLPYAYDEYEIAEYYKLYENLMRYWHEVLPEKIYDLSYEGLINSPENSIRELLEYCDLEWSDACLDFHKTKRSVTTASAMQVKQPLYKTALGYWQKYEPYMSDDIKSLV